MGSDLLVHLIMLAPVIEPVRAAGAALAAPGDDPKPIINALEGIRNLMLLFGLPVAGVYGGRAAFQLMGSAGEMQDQIKARKSLEYVGYGLMVLFGAAIVLSLIANEFRKAGLVPTGL